MKATIRDGVLPMYNGRKIRELRELRCWTQEQLAEIAKLSPRTIQRLEKGQPASLESLRAVSQALQVSFEEIRAETNSAAQKLDHVSSESALKQDDFLPRILSGSELLKVIAGSEMYQFSNDELKDDEEVDLVSSFAQMLQDMGDLWDELDAGAKVKAGFDFQKELEQLTEKGFWVFGKQVVQKFVVESFSQCQIVPLKVAVVRIVRNTNPEIITRNRANASIFGKY